MPQSGSYTAVVDKIKGRGTDDISLEELSTKLKRDDKNEHSEVRPELGLDLFAICCPAGACQLTTAGAPHCTMAGGVPESGCQQKQQSGEGFCPCSAIPCVSWRHSLD